MMNDIYHTCRWCKWFDKESGHCINERVFEKLDDNILYPFYEDGTLSEAIKEGFKDFKFAELEQALFESKLSKKRVAEIMKLFNEELESAFANWTETIDGSVSSALNNYDFRVMGSVPIADPSDFYCKHFW